MKNKIDTSRQKTPWDYNEEKNVFQRFIMTKYKENYNLKHPKLSEIDEAYILNAVNITNCGYCDSRNIKKVWKNKK